MIAGDISSGCEGAELDKFSLVFEYVFILLMGDSEWSDLEPNKCLGPVRSILLKIFMWCFSLLGTIILLNLLIAMMGYTYEQVREDKTPAVNFARAQQIYSLAYKFAIIPPPLNIIVYGLGCVWWLMEFIIFACSRGWYVLNLRKFVPVRVEYYKQVERFENWNASPLAYQTEIETIFSENEHKGNDDQRETKMEYKCFKFCMKLKKKRRGLMLGFKQNYARKAKYCRFCKCYMRESVPGSIEYYCALFRQYKIQDEEMRMLSIMTQFNGICPECFRPYKLKPYKSPYTTNRLYRRQIIWEILSFYVFIVLLYLPLVLLSIIVAGIFEIYELLSNCTDIKLKDKYLKSYVNSKRHSTLIKSAVDDAQNNDGNNNSDIAKKLAALIEENRKLNERLMQKDDEQEQKDDDNDNSSWNQKMKEIKNDQEIIKLDKLKMRSLKEEISSLIEGGDDIEDTIISKRQELNDLNREIQEKQNMIELNNRRAKVMQKEIKSRKSGIIQIKDDV